MKRKGRKRADGPRNKGGRLVHLSIKDKGTNEVIMRRAILSGGGDETLTETFLGVMLANQRITRSEYDAGRRYAWLFGVLFGKTGPAIANYGAQGGEKHHDEAWLADRQAEYNTLANGLQNAGRRYKEAVDNICIYDRWPRWIASAVKVGKMTTLRKTDIAKRDEFERGMILLAEYCGFQKAKDRRLAA